MSDAPEIIIIDSGIGGAAIATALAPTGKSIFIPERGERLTDSSQALCVGDHIKRADLAA